MIIFVTLLPSIKKAVGVASTNATLSLIISWLFTSGYASLKRIAIESPFLEKRKKIHIRHIFLMAGLMCLFAFILRTAVISRGDDGEKKIIVDPVSGEEGYSAILYDNTNGLPTSEANDIAETDDGFIWIGSYSGLVRYDGNTFERIPSTTGITSVKCLYVDSRGCL